MSAIAWKNRLAVLAALCAMIGCAVRQPAAAPLLLDIQPSDANIHLLLSGGVAGQALHVDGLEIPLSAGTQLTAQYDWDFGDPDSRFNTLSGWNAAHLYAYPGSYAITLKITQENGAVANFKSQVQIARPHRAMYFVAGNGSDSNDGLDPSHPLRSVARAFKKVPDHTQLLFRRGDSFPFNASVHLNGQDVIIGAYTDPAAAHLPQPAPASLPPATGPATHPSTLPLAPPDDRPRLLWVGERKNLRMIELGKSASDVTIRDLCFDTIFTGDSDSRDVPSAIQAVGTNIAVMHCRFLNVDAAVNCELGPTGVLVQDCDAPQVTPEGQVLAPEARDTTTPGITGMRTYFTWIVGSDVVILGNTVANSTREHCVRISGGRRILVAYNDLQNLDRETVDKQDISKGTVVAQIGDHLYVTHNTLRSGPAGAGPLNRPDLVADPARHQDAFTYAVFDGNTFRCPLLLQPGLAHAMIRNNVCYRDDWGAFLINGYDANYTRGVTDACFLHNTVINYGTKGNFLQTSGRSEHITLANNLFIAPNLNIATGTGALVISEPDLSSFDTIKNNVWPIPAKITSSAQGGINSMANRFETPDEWAQEPKVSGDRYLSVSLDDKLRPTTAVDVPAVAGVSQAMDGAPRGATTSAGALQR